MTLINLTPDHPDYEKVTAHLAAHLSPDAYRLLLHPPGMTSIDFFGLYVEDCFLGTMITARTGSTLYLLHLCLLPAFRRHRFGAEAVALLIRTYPFYQVVTDVLLPDDDADDNMTRIRLRNFYLNHGFRTTGHFLTLGCDSGEERTEILCCSRFDPDEFMDLFISLYEAYVRMAAQSGSDRTWKEALHYAA